MDVDSDDGVPEFTIHDLDRAPAPLGEHQDHSSVGPPSPAVRPGGGLRPRLFSGDSSSSVTSAAASTSSWQSRRRLWSADDVSGPEIVSQKRRGGKRRGASSRHLQIHSADTDDSSSSRCRSMSDLFPTAARLPSRQRGMNFIPEVCDSEGEQQTSSSRIFPEDEETYKNEPQYEVEESESSARVPTYDDGIRDYYGAEENEVDSNEWNESMDEDEFESESDSGGCDSVRTDSSGSDQNRAPLNCLGVLMPCSLPTVNQIAVCVVKFAPCFCCLGFKQHTDRLVLGRLNVILVFMSAYQLASSIFLLVVLVSERIAARQIEFQIGIP